MVLIPEQPAAVDFSILIPVYNSEKSLPLVVQGVREEFEKLNYSHEFVLVDDGSMDNSWKVIEQMYEDGDICAIRFMKNMGHSIAFKRGLEFCLGQRVITMDDDLQHPPKELPKLISAATENPHIDVIMGAYGSDRGAVHKSMGSRLFQFVLRKAFNSPKSLVMTSFRVIHRRVVDELVAKKIANPQAGYMILSTTDRIINVQVERHDRQFGRSGMSLKKSITTVIDCLVLNSEWPLKLIGFGGLAMSLISFFLALYYGALYFSGNIGVSGFATTVLLIIGFSGLILGSISVVGLYIMRIMQQSNFTPDYRLREYLPRGEADQ